MPISPLIDDSLDALRLRLSEAVKSLHEIALASKSQELAQTVSELRDSLGDPFLFVVVGEVKAGKSSFINALLDAGREVCAVAPDPCTDAIYQIQYGEKDEQITLSPRLRKVLLPIDILRHISIVDTPGTNTLVDEHQEITTQFVPRSDLIVFVFEAKNPYRQSAWQFFDFISQEWRKKVVFVLQQSDLVDEREMEVNQKGLRETMQKKGVADAPVFAVSAKRELAGQHDTSGFPALREYIRTNITGKNAVALKLGSLLRSARLINGRLLTALDQIALQLESDRQFREDIRLTLADQESISVHQAQVLVGQLTEDYDRIVKLHLLELENGLSFFTLTRRSVMAAFSKEQSPAGWLEAELKKMGQELNSHLEQRVTDGVENLAERVQQMVRVIDMRIEQAATKVQPHRDLFGEISLRRRGMLDELRKGFARFMEDNKQFLGPDGIAQASAVAPNLAAGSGIAVIGAVLAAVTQGMVLDVTGGILSALGLVFAGATVVLKRRKIMDGFRKESELGKERLHVEVTQRLTSYIKAISGKVEAQFTDFDIHLTKETDQLARLQSRVADLDQQLSQIQEKLDS